MRKQNVRLCLRALERASRNFKQPELFSLNTWIILLARLGDANYEETRLAIHKQNKFQNKIARP